MNGPAIALPLARTRIGGGSIGAYDPVCEDPRRHRQPGEYASTPRAAENPTAPHTERRRRPFGTRPGSAGPQPRANNGDAKKNRPLPRRSRRPRRGLRRHRRGPARTGRNQRHTGRAHPAPVREAKPILSTAHGRPAPAQRAQRRVRFSGRRGPLALLFERLQEGQHRRLHRKPRHPVARRPSKRSGTRSETF